MPEFLVGRLLEGVYLHPGRVDRADDVPNDTSLASGVQTLEHQKDAGRARGVSQPLGVHLLLPIVDLGVELIVESGDGALALTLREPWVRTGIEVPQHVDRPHRDTQQLSDGSFLVIHLPSMSALTRRRAGEPQIAAPSWPSDRCQEVGGVGSASFGLVCRLGWTRGGSPGIFGYSGG